MKMICAYSIVVHLHVNPSSGNHSAIDLSLCNPTAYMDFAWNVYDDTSGCDHFPILIQKHPAGI